MFGCLDRDGMIGMEIFVQFSSTLVHVLLTTHASPFNFMKGEC